MGHIAAPETTKSTATFFTSFCMQNKRKKVTIFSCPVYLHIYIYTCIFHYPAKKWSHDFPCCHQLSLMLSFSFCRAQSVEEFFANIKRPINQCPGRRAWCVQSDEHGPWDITKRGSHYSSGNAKSTATFFTSLCMQNKRKKVTIFICPI